MNKYKLLIFNNLLSKTQDMIIKLRLITFCILLHSVTAFAQIDIFQGFNINKLDTSLMDIDLPNFNGFWHAENLQDSIYLFIADPTAHYSQTDSLPYKAILDALLIRIERDMPYKIAETRYVQLIFSNIEILPTPKHSRRITYKTEYGDAVPSNYVLPKYQDLIVEKWEMNTLILNEKDLLTNSFQFHKLEGLNHCTGLPQFIDKQKQQLSKIRPMLNNIWANETDRKYLLLNDNDAVNPISDFCTVNPQLFASGIEFDIINQDSITAKSFSYAVQFVEGSYFLFTKNYSDSFKLYIGNEETIYFEKHTSNVKERFTKHTIDVCPENISKDLKNRLWCSTFFNERKNRIDTSNIDFGSNEREEGMYHEFREGWNEPFIIHNYFHVRFIAFQNHWFMVRFYRAFTHIEEIIKLTEDILILRGFDNEGVMQTNHYFLHPKNKSYWQK